MTLSTLIRFTDDFMDHGGHSGLDLPRGDSQVMGRPHPATLTVRNDLARILGRDGQHANAELILNEVITDRLQIMSHDHPFVLITRSELAWTIGEQGRFPEAELMLDEVADDRRRILGRHRRSVAVR